jgi:DNA-binding CsgD family transcriptional regulator
MEDPEVTTIEETVSLASSMSRDGEVLVRKLGELITVQRRLLAGWEKLARTRAEPVLETWAEAEVRALPDASQIAAVKGELCASAIRRLRIIGDDQQPRAGVRCQVIRSAAARNTGPGTAEVRFRDRVPCELVHADDSIAIVTTGTGDTRRAVLINSSAMVAITADWFDQLWNGSRARADTSPPITEQQRRVLALMPTADDRVIARKLDISVTTVRRQIKAIYDALGVNNRFAAGMSAVKRGWI